MRAVAALRFGGPEVLSVIDLPEPHPEEGEIRIRVRAAAVNPADCSIRGGTPRAARMLHGRLPPYLPGMDAAGVVDEVGRGVADFSLGDPVMAIVLPSRPAGGAYAEHVVVPASSAALAPKNLDVFRTATIPMNGLTALRALELLDLRPGQTLAVTGAAGALGSFVVQLATLRDLQVIAVAAESDRERLRDLGVHLLVPRGPRIAQRIKALVPCGVDGAVDAALLHESLVPAIRDGGAIATVRMWDWVPERGITALPVQVSDYSNRSDLLAELAIMVERGVLRLNPARVVPAVRAPTAHRLLEGGGLRSRIVLHF